MDSRLAQDARKGPVPTIRYFPKTIEHNITGQQSRTRGPFSVEATRKRKTFKFNSPPPGWRAASLKPGQKMMERYADGEAVAIAIIHAWDPALSEVRRQAVVFAPADRPAAAAHFLEGAAMPNADLDALLAEWHRTRSAEARDTLLLSAQSWLQTVCRAITLSPATKIDGVKDTNELYPDVYAAVEDALLTSLQDDADEINDLKAYLYRVALNVHNGLLRGEYIGRKKDGEDGMRRFAPLSEAKHLTTDDGDDLELWRERPASAVEDPAVAAIAQMLQDGLKIDEVCRTLGISYSGLCKRISRYRARHAGSVNLNGCADELHIVQANDDELHNVQAQLGNQKYFSEILSTFPDFAYFCLEGERFPLEMLPSGPTGPGDVIASLCGA